MTRPGRVYRLFLSLVSVVGVLSLTTCAQPGLGAKVDITAPVVKITTPSTGGKYLAGTIHLAGTDGDDIGVTGLRVTYPTASGDKSQEIPVSGGQWAVDLPSGAPGELAEGKDALTVSASDASGKVATDSVLVYVDNTAPTLMVTYPLSHGASGALLPQSTDTIDINGEVYDASPITRVVVSVVDATGNPLPTTDSVRNPNPKVADGTNTWSARFYLKGTSSIGGLQVADQTVYYYKVVATDQAGNENTWYYHSNDVAGLVSAGTPLPTTKELASIDHAETGVSSPSGIDATALAGVRLGAASPPSAHPAVWGDFSYVASSAPTIQFSNLTQAAAQSQNLLGPGSVVTGTIIPLPNTGAIDTSSVRINLYQLSVPPAPTTLPSPLLTLTSASTNLALTNLGSSLGFVVSLKDNAGTSLPPSAYYLTVSAKTAVSDAASAKVAFFIDSGAPSLSASASPTFANTPFTLAGNASAPLGLDHLDVLQSLNGGPGTNLGPVALTGTATPWTSPLLPSPAADGSYDYTLTLVTTSGKTATLYRSVTFDTTPPTVAINSVTPEAGANSVNGTVGFSSSATDANGLSGVKWGLFPAADTPPAWSDSHWNALTSPPYQASFDTTGNDTAGNPIVDNADDKLWVLAQDKAGNVGSASMVIHVSQSTDLPTIAFTNLDGTVNSSPTLGTTFPNLLGVGARALGSVADDDAVDPASVEIQIDGGAWKSLATAGTSVARTFSYDLTSLPEGLHSLRVRVADLASAKAGKSAVTTTSAPVYFAIDVSPPALAVTSPASGSLFNTGFTMTGTATDANGLQGNVVTIKNGTATVGTAAVAAGAWSFPVPAAEGTHAWTVTTTDVFGTSSTVPFTYTVDTTPPTPTISMPTAGSYVTGTTLAVSGTLSEAVAKVQVKVDSGAYQTATYTSGSTQWSYSLDLSSLAEGSHTLSVQATDLAGNTTTAPTSATFILDQNKPTLTETGIGAGSSGFQSGDFTLSGTFSDTVGFAATPHFALGVSVAGVAQPVAPTVVKTSAAGASPETYSWSQTIKVAGTATYDVTVDVQDASGKAATTVTRTVSIDQTPPTVAISDPLATGYIAGSAYIAKGTSADVGSSVKTLEYQLDGSAWTPFSVAAHWALNLDLTALGEGAHHLTVRATDQAGNVTLTPTLAFMVDQAPPTLTEAGASTITATSAFAFSGTDSDSNALASAHALQVSIDNTSAVDLSALPAPYSFTITGGAPHWQLGVAAGAGNLPDGVHTFIFTATDVAGRTSSLTRTVLLDTTPPVVASSVSSASATTTVTLTGTASDNLGLASVEYQIGSTAGPWSPVAGTAAWSQTIDLTTWAEGAVLVYFRAKDQVGNVSAPVSVTVNVDHANPRATVAPGTGAFVTVAGTPTTNAAFTLIGTADDAAFTPGRQAASAVLTYSKDGGVSTPAVGLTFNAAAGTWSWPMSVDTVTHADDGLYVFTLTVTDSYAKTTSVHQTLKIDTTAPTLAVTSPVAGELTANATYTLQGSALDFGVGLAKVQYNLGAGWADATVVGSTWSKTVNLGAEGPKTIAIHAIDLLGNTTSSGTLSLQYDAAPPTITETTVNSTNTQYTSATVVLAGTAADTNGLAAVNINVTKDGVAQPSVSLTVSSTTAPWTRTFSSLAEGTYVFTIAATDVAGRTSPAVTRTLVVDTTPPTATITAPGAGSIVSGNLVTLAGTLSESTIAGVRVSVDGGAPLTAAYTSGTSNWSLALDLTGRAEGPHTVSVAATDLAGNVTAVPAIRTFIYDTAPPLVSITAPATATSDTKQGFALAGVASDNYGVASIAITQKKDAGSAVPIATAGPAGTTSWTLGTIGSLTALPRDPANIGSYLLADGTYTYDVTATDLAGKTSLVASVTVRVDQSAPDVLTIIDPAAGQTGVNSLTGRTNVFRGTVSDAGVGTAKIWYRIDSSAAAAAGTTGYTAVPTGNGTWSFTDSNRAEGSYWLHVKAEDTAGNLTADANAVSVAFGIDVAAPTLSETTIGNSVLNTKAGFSITGTWAESQGVASFTVTQAKDGGAPVTLTTGFTTNTASPPGAAWSLASLPRDPNLPANTLLTDGLYVYVFTITDVAGKTSTLTRSVRFDATGPTTTILNPSDDTSWASATSYTISGAATDLTGVRALYSFLGAAAPSIPVDPTLDANWTANGWSKATGTNSWSVALTGLAEGAGQKLWVSAVDLSGNVTTPAARTFGVDTAPPTVTETGVGTAGGFHRTGFTFAGSAADTGSGVASVSVSLDGAAAVPVLGTTNWSYPVSPLPADGVHTYVFTVTDQTNKTTTLTRTISVDTTPATVTVASPAAGSYTNLTTVNLSGSANDGSGSGVQEVWYLIDGNPAAHAGDAYGAAGWVKATGTTNWTATAVGVTEGVHSLLVKVLDAVGNYTPTASSTLFTVDATAPTLTEDSPTTIAGSARAGFSFGATAGVATDALAGVASFTVSDNGGAATAVTPGAAWTFPVAVDAVGHTNDGTHTYVFTLADKAGNQTTLTRTVLIDTTPAAVTVSAPTANFNTNNTTVALAGSTNDGSGSGVKQVWFRVDASTIDHSTDAYNATGWVQAVGTTNWSASVSSLSEGIKKLWVKTLDNAGNVTTAAAALANAVTFTVDTTAPVLSEASPVSTAGRTNGGFTFGATSAVATDALSGVQTLTVSDNGVSLGAVTITSGVWNYPIVLDTIGHTNDGTHTYLFTLTDKAGNQANLTRTIVVDTTAASATIASPVAASFTNSATVALAGSANDGSGTGVKEVWYYVDASPATHAADAYNAAGWTKATGTTSWSATATVSEGAHTLLIKTLDNAGNSNTTAVAAAFSVDLTAPVATETGVGAGTVTKNAAYTFTGTAVDPTVGGVASTVSTLTVSDNGGAPTAVTVAAGTWSYSPVLPADGTHTYVFTLTDKVGNQSTLTRTVLVDTAAASATITAPVAAAFTNSATVALAGSANDGSGSGVKEVWYYVDANPATHAGDAYNATGWTKATGTTSWSATATVSEGAHTLLIKTLDNAGNTNAAALAVAFSVDLTAPVTTETAVGAGTVTRNSAYTFTGTAVDPTAGGVASAVSTLTVSDNGAAPTSVPVAAGAWSYAPTLPADGTHTYVFTLTDQAGNHSTLTRSILVDTTAATPVVTAPVAASFTNSASVSLAGSANDGSGSGVKEVWYYVDANPATHSADAYNAVGWTKATGTTTWSATAALTEGAHTLLVKTLDNAGNSNAAALAVAFNVDLTAPVASETAVGAATVTRNASFSFSGTALDPTSGGVASSVASLSVSDNGTGLTPVTVTAGSWSYSPPLPTDGSHTYTFHLSDTAGNQSTLTRTVFVDTTAASASVVAPAAASYAGSTLALSGSANDGAGSGVSQVWYRVDASAVDHSADAYNAAGWAQASGTTTWTASVTGLTEGAKKLWVKTVDGAGNVTSAAAALAGAVAFTVDLNPPALAETGVGATAAVSAGFTLSGTASDSVALAAAHAVQVSVDGAPAVDAVGTAAWSFPVAVNAVTHANDGTHTYTVTATDASGKTTTLVRTLLIDTVVPTVTFNNISAAGGTVFQDTTGKVTGTLASASGLASSATVLLEQYDYRTALWSPVPGFNNASLGITGTPKTSNWTVDLGAAGLPDGKYRLSFVVPNATVPTLTLTSGSPVPFVWSRSNPSVSVVAPTLGTFQNAAFPVAGTAFDYNAVTSVVAKIASGTVDFSVGTTPALAALPAAVALGSPAVFTTATSHNLTVGDLVYLNANPMPTANVPLLPGTAYYVNSVPTANSFTLTTALTGGTVVAVSSSTASDLLVASSKISFVPAAQSVSVTANNANLTTSPLPAVGQTVFFEGTGLPAGLSGSSAYSVVSVGTSTFQVSATAGGPAVTPTGSGTVSLVSPVSWLIPSLATTGLADGSQTVYLQVSSSSSGKASVTTRDFTFDKTAPTVALTSPTSGTRSVGNLTLLGTTTDSGAIPSGVTGTIQYQVGKNYNLTTGWTNANVTGGAYSWSIALGDMSGYANATYATECDTNGNAATGTNLWRLPIVFQATDKAGNVQQKTDYYLILDPNGNIPVMTVTQPSNNLTFGGQQRITGTASQPTWIHDVEVSVDPSATGAFAATVPASTLTFATGQFTATAHGLVNGQVVYVKNAAVTGVAGVPVNPKFGYFVINATANTFQLSATLNGPAVTFTNLLNGNATELLNVDSWYPATLVTTGNSVIWYYDINVGNVYPTTGTSQTVQVQVRAWNSPTAGGARGTIEGGLTSPLTMTFNSTFPKIAGLQVDGRSYYSQITTRGSAISLSGQISSSKGIAKVEVVESSPLSGSTTAYDSTALTQTGFRTTGASKVVGGATEWTSTVAPATVATSFTFPASSSYKVLITNPGSNPALWVGAATTTAGSVYAPAGGTTLNVAATGGEFLLSNAVGDFVYNVTMSINSTKLYNNTTGQYSFDLRATDMGSPAQVSASNITLNEDNYFPTSSLTSPNVVTALSMKNGNRYMIVSVGTTDFTLYGAQSNTVGLTFLASGAPATGTGTVYQVITNLYQNTSNAPLDAQTGTYLTGTVFKLQGSATDTGSGSGTIGGLSKVVVYLRNPVTGNLLDLKTGGVAQAAGTLQALDVTGSGTLTSVPYPASDAYTPTVTGPAYFASIDSLTETGTSDSPALGGNGDGFVESFSINGSSRDWWAQIDTTNLPDGPVELHYVVWDAAGNASHYKVNSFVSNNAPVLASIDLGTDLNGNGNATDPGEVTNFPAGSNFAASGFSVRNSLLTLKVNTTRGTNTPLYYSVKYNGTEQNGTLTSNTVTITNFGSIPDSANATANDRTFAVLVYDSTPGTTAGTNSQSFFQTIAMNIQNRDSSPPTVNAAPFGTLYSAGTSDAAKGLRTLAYTQSLGPSGGHLEYGAVNPYRTVTAVSATAMTAGQGYLIWTLGSTDFTALGASATAVSNLSPGLWYLVQSAGSTDFTTVGAASVSPAVGTAFQATKAGVGSGTVIPVGTTFIYNGAPASGTGTVKPLDAPPALSGQVVFRGKAYDNQRLSRLTATIPGFDGGSGVGAEFTVATWSGTGLAAAPSNGNWSWALDAADSVTQSNGHVLNWNLTWDSSKLTPAAQSAVNAVFRAYDFWTSGTGATTTATSLTAAGLAGLTIPAGTPLWIGTIAGNWSSGSWTTVSTPYAGTGAVSVASAPAGTGMAYVLSNTPGTATQTVDVVPYISTVTTRLASAYSSKPSVLQRSALGSYPVAEGETGVTLSGYNLTGASATVSMNGYTTITASGTTSISFTVPTVAATALSGPLVVTENGISSENNLNNNQMPWNSQANGVNNNLLTDDLNVAVWSFTSILADGGVRFPNFRVGTDASQTFGFIYDSGSTSVKMATNTAVTATTPFQIDQSYTQWYDTSLAVDANGSLYGSAQNGDSGGTGNLSPNKNYANNMFYAWNTAASPGTNNTGSTGAYNSGTKKVAIENAFNGTTFDSSRIQNAKIAVGTGTYAGNVYHVYYDHSDNQLRFRWGTVTGTYPTPTFGGTGGALANYTTASGSAANYQVIAGSGATGTSTVLGTTNVANVGPYIAVGVVSTGTYAGTAVVAWYDSSNQRLLYSYNTAPTSTANAANWGTNTIALDSSFAGWYVDLVVDTLGQIHIAYYNSSTGDLKYAFLSAPNAAPQVSTVDSFLSVGTDIGISVDNSVTPRVPYITYYMGAYTQTNYSVRVAWRTDFSGNVPQGAVNDAYTGLWETMTLPTSSIPLDYRVGVGIKKNGAGTNVPLVGYGTTAGLETAQLK